MRIGVLRLTDAAPVIVAQELGFFAEEDVPALLSVEASWSNIADKLAHGFLDAAVILPPLAFAAALGLRGTACRLIVPQVINLGGNCITLGRTITERLSPPRRSGPAAILESAQNLAASIRSGESVRLAVVHQYSTHNLLLRYWLAAGGIDPDTQVSFSVFPPSQMVEALERGVIDGFCAGAPWGDIAVARGLGTNVASSHGIWRNGPEKVFAVCATWAGQNAGMLLRAQRALLRAAQYCDKPENAAPVSQILARPESLSIDADVIGAALPGDRDDADIWRRPALRFFRHAATMPWLSHAEWYLHQMQRWGQLPQASPVSDIASALYRPDLYRTAAGSLGLPVPLADRKTEGHASEWALDATPQPLAMEPDGFCDEFPE